jgi:phosphoglycerol transferase
MKILNTNSQIHLFFVTISLGLILIFLNFRNLGLYPLVFADEWLYSTYSRVLPMVDSPRPMYLFYWIFGSTNICGDAFLSCARFINSVMYILAFPFLFKVSRQYMTRSLAIYISICALLLPINVYTAYFMPETLQFLLFWIFMYFLVVFSNDNDFKKSIAVGIILGLMSVVKPHALSLIPIAWIFFYLLSSSHLLKIIFINIFFAILTKMIAGYLFVGVSGLNFFGQDYSGLVKTVGIKEFFGEIIPLSIYNFYGHLIALIAIFGIPLYFIFNDLLCREKNKDKLSLIILSKFSLILTFTLITIYAIFAGKAAGMGQYESIERLSLRYYDFIFPLFLIIMAANYNKLNNNKLKNILIYCAIILFSSVAIGKGFLPNLVDAPALSSLISKNYHYIILISISVLILLTLLLSDKLGKIFYLFIYLPLFILFTNHSIINHLKPSKQAGLYDQACQFTNKYLGDNVKKLLIIGPDLASLYRCNFYMSNPGLGFRQEKNGVNISSFSDNVEWLLLFGNYEVERYMEKFSIPVIDPAGNSLGEYSLIHVSNPSSMLIEVDSQTPHTTGKFGAIGTARLYAVKGDVGALMFGPYKKLKPGRYSAKYFVTAKNENSEEVLGNVDVASFDRKNNIEEILTSGAITKAYTERGPIELIFDVDNKNVVYQFRVWVNGVAQMVDIASVEVKPINNLIHK